MHPVLAVTLAMVSATALLRWCAREVRRVNSELERVRAQARAAMEPIDRNALPTLKRDPVTGEYRPG
jgi:hypothetical protein